MLDDDEDRYQIRVRHDPTGRYIIAYNEKENGDHCDTFEILATDFDKVWSLHRANRATSEADLERVAANPVHRGLPLTATLVVRVCATKIEELEAKVKAQETELRALKRQLSLASPVETSPTKAQVQASALKGKSLLNPRVKRAKSKKSGDLFSSDEDDQ